MHLALASRLANQVRRLSWFEVVCGEAEVVKLR